MFDLEKLAKLRFGMTQVPKIGGQPGTYEEKWSQWLLERSFFRDFVYRNPRGKKKGEELADAVVLFDDVVVMVQVKAQCGKHDPMSWATEKLLEAFRQLGNTYTSLVGGHIKKLRNDFYGEMVFDPKAYPNRIGLIILAHDSGPYSAAKLAPEILTADFPVHVFSLKDFAMLASRFDTAGDLITFLEMRGDVASKEPLLVQAEETNIEKDPPARRDGTTCPQVTHTRGNSTGDGSSFRKGCHRQTVGVAGVEIWFGDRRYDRTRPRCRSGPVME